MPPSKARARRQAGQRASRGVKGLTVKVTPIPLSSVKGIAYKTEMGRLAVENALSMLQIRKAKEFHGADAEALLRIFREGILSAKLTGKKGTAGHRHLVFTSNYPEGAVLVYSPKRGVNFEGVAQVSGHKGKRAVAQSTRTFSQTATGAEVDHSVRAYHLQIPREHVEKVFLQSTTKRYPKDLPLIGAIRSRVRRHGGEPLAFSPEEARKQSLRVAVLREHAFDTRKREVLRAANRMLALEGRVDPVKLAKGFERVIHKAPFTHQDLLAAPIDAELVSDVLLDASFNARGRRGAWKYGVRGEKVYFYK